jgi:large subunit ribosomal protein L25
MEKIELKAKTRSAIGRQNKKIRQAEFIPVVLYGHGIKNQNLQVSYQDFLNVFNRAGESTLIDLIIDNEKPIKVIIQDYQQDPVKDIFVHVDFYQVKMTEEITTEVELEFIGESKAVKELGGTLVKNMDTVEIKCLPGDLISKIEVDISGLNDFDDTIRVKDLSIPEKIKILDDIQGIVATVAAPRTQEELEELEEKVEEKVEAVEMVKEKAEEAEAESAKEGEGEERQEKKK